MEIDPDTQIGSDGLRYPTGTAPTVVSNEGNIVTEDELAEAIDGIEGGSGLTEDEDGNLTTATGIQVVRGDGGSVGDTVAVWIGTQGEYEAIDPKDPNTVYVTDGTMVGGGGGGVYGAVESTLWQPATTLSTTSTTFVDISASLPALVLTDLEVGQIVELELSLSVRNATDGNVVMFDWLIDRPTSADTTIRATTGGKNAGHFTQKSNAYDTMVLIAVEFTVTEAGTHTFKPQWRVGAGTAQVRGADDANYAAPILHRVRERL